MNDRHSPHRYAFTQAGVGNTPTLITGDSITFGTKGLPAKGWLHHVEISITAGPGTTATLIISENDGVAPVHQVVQIDATPPSQVGLLNVMYKVADLSHLKITLTANDVEDSTTLAVVLMVGAA